MNEVLGYVFAGILYIFIVAVIFGWIVLIFYKIRCGKKENCLNEKCPYRIYCNKTAPTPREKEMVEVQKQEIFDRIERLNRENCPDEKAASQSPSSLTNGQ